MLSYKTVFLWSIRIYDITDNQLSNTLLGNCHITSKNYGEIDCALNKTCFRPRRVLYALCIWPTFLTKPTYHLITALGSMVSGLETAWTCHIWLRVGLAMMKTQALKTLKPRKSWERVGWVGQCTPHSLLWDTGLISHQHIVWGTWQDHSIWDFCSQTHPK